MKLTEALERQTVAGELCRIESGKVRCLACRHHCLLAEGQAGICRVRFVRDGTLRVPFGYVVGGIACDPVEKKPFYHLYPGSDAVTFGMLGCNFHCEFCQNWLTSQALREDVPVPGIVPVSAGEIARLAHSHGARLVVSSYNEPVISAEWAKAVFEESVKLGLKCAFVSNGYASKETLEYLRPVMIGYKVDLKSFNESNYRRCGGSLQNVLETIKTAVAMGYWVEIVTLVVPGFNDEESELRQIAQFIASVDRSIPWHVTAFHPDYKYTDAEPTPASKLIRAAEIGKEEGLYFVYAGNLPGRVSRWENTYCPACGELLVERFGFSVRQYKLTPHGTCPKCKAAVPGHWYSEDDFNRGLVPPRSMFRHPRHIL